MKTLLLVGASGFLGQHLKHFYEDLGWRVLKLGRKKDDEYPLDGNNLNALERLKLHHKVDRIVHTAAVNETQIDCNLSCTYTINVTMTRLLLELAKKHKIPEFVYLSTFHVYGKGDGRIDDGSATEPKNDYGLTHYLSERIVQSLGPVLGIRTLIVRPTNIFGIPIDMASFDRWTLVPFAFVRSGLNEGLIEIHSSGLQVRNFVGVADVCAATDMVGAQIVINAYGLDTLTIRDFALLVKSRVNADSEQDCQVIWQDKGVDEKAAELFVSNSFDDYRPQQRLNDYIVQFIKVLK